MAQRYLKLLGGAVTASIFFRATTITLIGTTLKWAVCTDASTGVYPTSGPTDAPATQGCRDRSDLANLLINLPTSVGNHLGAAHDRRHGKGRACVMTVGEARQQVERADAFIAAFRELFVHCRA